MSAPHSLLRPRSGSRLSRVRRRGQPPLADDMSDYDESQSAILGQADVQSQGMLRPRTESRAESSPIGASFSSSMKQRTPTRSYYQPPFHSSLPPGGPPHDPSQGVREDTAELASWALSDAGSIRSDTPTTRRAVSESENNPANLDAYLDETSDTIKEVSEPPSSENSPPTRVSPGTSALTEMIRSSPPNGEENGAIVGNNSDEEDDDECPRDFGPVIVRPGIISQPHEGTSLLKNSPNSNSYRSYTNPHDVERLESPPRGRRRFPKLRLVLSQTKNHTSAAFRTVSSPKSWNRQAIWQSTIVQPAGFVPAIVLGLLLNILDALSYGMILFPLGQPIFANLGPDGISMFYVSCIVSQLVYSLGGSIFKGGIGSEMIEVVPFFHQMAFTIIAEVGEDNPRSVVATTILAYSLSSVLTGAVFFIMGRCKLGSLIGFFPRHILIGCIGGVGWFLVATGVEVSARLDGNLEYNLITLKKLFQADTIALWVTPLVFAGALLLTKRWVKHSLTDAVYFLSIIIVFYFFVAAIPDLQLEDLRSKGWVFAAPEAGVPFYHFYSLYDFGSVNWTALASTIPAMFALTFFGILHVPINIPALGLTTGEDNVDVDRELRAHGLSNALSGLCGSVQNYLVYTNTVLFMRSGGDSRVAGVLLAFATFGVLVIGPVLIGFIPIMVVGALIFFLGIDLMREALIDTWGRVHRLEYLTIVIIVVTMGAYDFVVGILVGIILACVSFVLQTSQISAIRSTLPGGIATSTVRRHETQYRFLNEVGRQIHVMKLGGYLFFGTIVGVENRIEALLKDDIFNSEPIQFLVLDLSKVDGVDFSAAGKFSRINRMLGVKNVRLIMCGFEITGEVGQSLYNLGLLNEETGVEFFGDLNSALEFCENDLLRAFYQRRDALVRYQPTLGYLDIPEPNRSRLSDETFFSSPRRGQLHQAAYKTLQEQQDTIPHNKWQRYKQPLQLILQTFWTVSDKDEDFWTRAVQLFERRVFSEGTVLYTRDDRPNGFYLLETGILKAEYKLPQGGFSEVIVAGTTCGELPFFSATPRTSTTVAERDCVTWMLNNENWEEVQRQQPDIAMELLKISLKLTSERMETITKYILVTSG